MGFWAAIAAAATAMFMSSYIRCFLGLRFLGNAKVCSTMRRPGWERWWIGEANCPFTIKRSLDWNAMDLLVGKLLPFKLRKMEMMRLAQGTNAFCVFCITNAIRKRLLMLPAALWMVWIQSCSRFVHCEGPADKVGRTYRRQKHWKNDVNKGQTCNSQVLEKQKISLVLWWNWH